MDKSRVLAFLDAEIERLQQARELLSGSEAGDFGRNGATPRRSGSGKRRQMSEEARRRISEAQKKRWAARKKSAAD